MIKGVGHWADLQPEAGGLFALDVEKTIVRGRCVPVEPPTRIVVTRGVPGSDLIAPGSTMVEIVLTADGPDTIVELLTTNLPLDE
jgi:uncharacterized protein YndB with AHSA1/START domain